MRRKPWVAAVGFAVLAGAGLVFTNPKVLTGDAGGAGCTPEDYADSQLAKQEGQYLVMEVMVALALGLDQAYDVLDATGDITDDPTTLTDPVALARINEENCYSVAVTDATAVSANVGIDFGSCSDRSGRVEMAVATEYPQGFDPSTLGGLDGTDVPRDVDPGDLPSDLPSDLPAGAAPVAVAYDMTMFDTQRFGVLLEGLIGFTQPADEDAPQGLRTDLSFDFLDYAGTLTTTGTLRSEGDDSDVDFTGTFKSVGGLDWTVDATGLRVNADCKGLKAGRLVATYSNPAIDLVEVVATFDGACNGCAQVEIDGRKVSDVCIPEALGL
jgi:hypothetical protein